MLHSLKINNFESHRNTVLEFAPGVNAIIGASDSGKSGILKALYWAIFNRPTGSSFVPKKGTKSRRKDNNFTNVEIKIDDATILRSRNQKENLYTIIPNDLSQKQIKFKAFGAGVPEEISSLFNISDINIQKQFDAPFLLSSTAGEVGRQLNKAVKLDIIDVAQTNINRILKEEQNLLKSEETMVLQKQEDLKQYEWLPEAEAIIKHLEMTSSQISTTKIAISDLSAVISSLDTIEANLEKAGLILQYDARTNELIVLDKDIETATDTYNALSNIVTIIDDNEKQIIELSKLTKADKQINKLIKVQENWDKINNDHKKLSLILYNVSESEEKLQTKIKDMEIMLHTFNKEMPSFCPLCEQEIK